MKILKILTILKTPFIIYDKENNYTGYLIDILKEISKELKFEYEIEVQNDGQYGYMDDKGNWNGMIGILKERKADIGLAAVSLMSERMKVVDFTESIYKPTGISVLMRRPVHRTALFKFLTVLDKSVWFCIVGSYLLTSVLLWIYDIWSPYSYRNEVGSSVVDHRPRPGKEGSDERVFTLKESLWFSLTSLTPQGGGEAPRNLSGRLVAVTWWLFGFIIIASYTANLAAYLTIAKFEKSIDTFDDLIPQYRYTYTVIQNSSTYRYFKRMNDIEYKFYDIWKDMTLNDSLTPYQRAQFAVWEYPLSDKYIKIFSAISHHKKINNTSEALDILLSNHSRFALITEATDVQYQVMTDCRFREVGPEFSKKPYAIALQKNSPYTKKFNDIIFKIQRNGMLDKLKKKWWELNPERKYCYDYTNAGINLDNIGGLFILILFGITVAFSTLIYEFSYFTYQRKKCRLCRKKNRIINIRNQKIVTITRNLP